MVSVCRRCGGPYSRSMPGRRVACRENHGHKRLTIGLAVSLAVASLLGLNGCGGGSCAGVGTDALPLPFSTPAANEVCDATVIATDAQSSYTLLGGGQPRTCVYTGGPEQESVYTISARAGACDGFCPKCQDIGPKVHRSDDGRNRPLESVVRAPVSRRSGQSPTA